MLSFLTLRALLVGTGFVLMGLFIWFAGPYFSFADYRPLESMTARVIAIVLIVLCWCASIVLKRLRANKASDNLMSAVARQSEADQSRPSAEAAVLRERFEEAVAELKSKRRGGHSLYDLPWYVIIGPPGSGKTTALVNSGLKFPVEQRTGKGALRGVGGTRNCDWWFTDEAVLLDTAGRYMTQDSDAGADSAAWAEFLALLRKYRKRRPVNGVILTISAHDLMTMDHGGREAHVFAARRRLEELNKELRIHIPVYVMVTKCDLVSGFTEYFDDLDQSGRSQVWGVTFPYDQTLKGEAVKRVLPEFDELIARLNSRVYWRLEEERDSRRRTRIFGFPHQMTSLRDALVELVTDVFESTRFERQILLRGVYFTSGTQEGTPIDRLLGALGRRFAAAPEAVVPAGRGKAYFIHRLLKDVLFAESGLAGVNRRVEMQKAAWQLAAYAAMLVVTVVGVAALTMSYRQNRAYVAQVAEKVAAVRATPPVGETTSLEDVLPRLDAIRAVVASAEQHQSAPPLGMRFGLFQGTALTNAARDAYVRELDGALLPQVTERIRERLREYVPEPEKLYEYLKAYLMLGQPRYLDKEQLTYIADLEWQRSPDANVSAALSSHFRSLLDYADTLREMPLDEPLVAQARSTIRQASIPGLIYRHVRLNYASDTARALRLDVEAGVGAERVLRRKSGLPLSQPVLSLYTAPVFREVTEKGTADFVKQFAADRWVWGDEGAPPVGSSELTAAFLDLYEKDYIATWDGLVKDVGPVPMSNLAATKEALAILAGPASPLRAFLKTVDAHTFLLGPQDPKPAQPSASGIGARLGGLFGRGEQPTAAPTMRPGAQITAYFEPIHQLVTGEAGAAPIDGILRRLEEIQQKVSTIGESVGGTSAANPAAVSEVSELTNSLRRAAAPLPPVVSAVVTEVATSTAAALRGGLRGTLSRRYEQDVLRECTEVTTGRYPFFSGSTDDVPLADFGRLFGYNGIYDTFFRVELQPLVDTTRDPWVWRADNSGVSVGGALPLSKFESAERIREMFFRSGSQEPQLRFSITPNSLTASAQRFVLEIDGQVYEDRHAATRTLAATWPGPKPGAATAWFEERSGARPNINARGPWAWFRLMDQARIERETDVRHTIVFTGGGHEARVGVEAESIRNPFGRNELQQFRCS
jgi:type VI secretion system protein ImpL